MAYGLGLVFFFSCVGIAYLVRKIVLAGALDGGRASTRPSTTPKRGKKSKKPSRAERGQRLATEEPPDEILGDGV